MTPGARAAAAIAVLDRILAGTPAEQALTNWARGSRFAGSGDRTAVRDLVFDAIRQRRSAAARGGAETGRGLVLGVLRGAGLDAAALFTGAGHAPGPLTAQEAAHDPGPLPDAVALDCPDWIVPALRQGLGAAFVPVMARLRTRAPVFLRVNLARASRADAVAALSAEGIAAAPHPLAASALELGEGARRIAASRAYRDGVVELQDAASQALVEALPLAPGMRVLDFCAGGGGKALAIAAAADVVVTAHDADAARMRDLPARAARAGARIAIAAPGRPGQGFDLVLADAPCSGSGAWRRQPDAKWRLTPERLAALGAQQDAVLDAAAAATADGGWLGYATCSLLEEENGARIAAFLGRAPGWQVVVQRRWTPLDGGDGFFLALMRRGGDAAALRRS